MARDKRLRQYPSDSPATPERFALLWSNLAVRTAAILVVAAAAFLAVGQLAGLGKEGSHSEPAFLTTKLGAPQRSESLVRKPAPMLDVRIERHGGYTVTHGRWHSVAKGASRSTSFGSESILVGNSRTE